MTRPTVDRVREAMGSMLESALETGIEGSSVLDAFAGSGALGIEMLSRGASHATFFDIDRNAASLVKKNVEGVGCDPHRFRVSCGDVVKLSRRPSIAGAPFDIVLIDAPYALGAQPACALLENLAATGSLAPDAVAVVEHAAADEGARPLGFVVEREKRYGITAVDLLRWQPEQVND